MLVMSCTIHVIYCIWTDGLMYLWIHFPLWFQIQSSNPRMMICFYNIRYILAVSSAHECSSSFLFFWFLFPFSFFLLPFFLLVVCLWVQGESYYNNDNSFYICTTDRQPPYLQCPDDAMVTLPQDATTVAVLWTEPTVSDNSGTDVALSVSHQPGSTFPSGVTRVTYTARDIYANERTCEFKVVVEGKALGLRATLASYFTSTLIYFKISCIRATNKWGNNT